MNPLMKKSTFISCVAAQLLACPFAFAQDECATAPTLVSGVASAFNTATATVTALPAVTDALCAGTFLGWGPTQKDVWFKWSATENGTADFSTCFAGSYDTSIVVYSGSCGALTPVACNGDGPDNAGCQEFYSLVSQLPVAAGTDYYVRIGGYTGTDTPDGATGTGAVTVTFTAGVDGCIGAIGACDVAHATPGCDTASCCAAVCSILPDCCTVGWDQGCVDVAIPECGYFQYSCVAPVQPNDCATSPQVISADGAVAFSNVGANSDGPGYGDSCGSGNNESNNDVWYRLNAIANGDFSISTCGTVPFDSKLAVYDLGTTPATFNYNSLPDVLVNCNDDGSATCLTTGGAAFASELTVTVSAGRSYLVCLSTFTNGETGSGSITFNVPEPCVLTPATVAEAEPCGEDLNGGCNMTTPVFEPIALGAIVEGTFWSSTESRDTDWYQFSIPSDRSVTVKLRSASLAQLFLLSDSCPGATLAVGSGSCPTLATGCLTPGTYRIAVVPSLFVTNPCNSGALNDYSLELTGVIPTTACPVLMDSTCQQPGPDTTASSASSVLSGNFGQGCATGCANGTGGTGDVEWATVFTGASLPKEISCVNMGVASLRSLNSAAGTCGYYASDLPIGAQVILYRDIDGGAPRIPIVTPGDGGDLETIVTRTVSIPGGTFLGNIEFDPPLCIENETNVVVALSLYNLFSGTPAAAGVPTGAGYRSGISLTSVPLALPSNIYNRSTACAITQFQVVNYTTATNRFQWPVELNGQAASCGSTSACPADQNNDGVVNGADLGLLLGAWGPCPNCRADINIDGVVNGADLGLLLGAWGPCS
jgi:hypothetical protein